jgi:hypothetical protein
MNLFILGILSVGHSSFCEIFFKKNSDQSTNDECPTDKCSKIKRFTKILKKCQVDIIWCLTDKFKNL